MCPGVLYSSSKCLTMASDCRRHLPLHVDSGLSRVIRLVLEEYNIVRNGNRLLDLGLRCISACHCKWWDFFFRAGAGILEGGISRFALWGFSLKFDFIIKSLLLLPVAHSLREVFIDTYSERFIVLY